MEKEKRKMTDTIKRHTQRERARGKKGGETQKRKRDTEKEKDVK